MKRYIVHDAGGKILRTGHCADADLELQAQEGECVIEGEAHDERHRIVDGKIVEIPEHERPRPPAPTVQQLRAAEYPPIGEQLDAIWKGGAALDVMRARVMAVKEKFPKE